MKNRKSTIIFTTLVLTCFAFLPKAKAVVPPPDGGYPGFTTAEGTNALKNLTTGAGNTAVGWFSLFSDTTASFNTGVGAGALILNNGDENTAIGTAALLFNTASGNTAIGSRALLNNTTGGTLTNVAGLDIGPNVAVGWQALESNTVASANTAVGYQALHSFTTGPAGFEQLGLCTAVGFQALSNNAANGFANSAVGYQTLMSNTTGSGNTANGVQALFHNTMGGSNTATGENALSDNTTGASNTANGAGALVHNTTGGANVAIGSQALGSNITAFQNTAVGSGALFASTGEHNIALGINAGANVTSASDVICIGSDGQNVSNSCYIGEIFGSTSSAGTAVFVNADGKLGTSTSSRRFKDDIKPMDKASEVLLAFKPVTFRYKKEIDPAGRSQLGLLAEDVEKVNPDLVVRDNEGKAYSVRYDQVNAMLLNEFLKEHKKMQELEAKIAQQQKDFEATVRELKKDMATMTAHCEEQDAKIQRVNEQIESTNPKTQLVATD